LPGAGKTSLKEQMPGSGPTGRGREAAPVRGKSLSEE